VALAAVAQGTLPPVGFGLLLVAQAPPRQGTVSALRMHGSNDIGRRFAGTVPIPP
jgi:hypothetical protein